MDDGNPMEQAMGFAAQMQQAQFNSAKLTIKWKFKNHTFMVESLNPLSAFELMERTKEVAKIRIGGDKNAKRTGKTV